jgi:Trk K+ transport system NAD-binding subunit
MDLTAHITPITEPPGNHFADQLLRDLEVPKMLSKLSKDLPRIAIIGVGQVGGAVAYALILASISCEILLVDVNVDRRKGQLHDLSDAAYVQHSSTFVREATYAEAGQSDIVIVTAGSRFTLGMCSQAVQVIRVPKLID